MSAVLNPVMLPAWLADVRRQFTDRTGLTGLLDARRVPARYRVQPRTTLARVERHGGVALQRLCERTGAATRHDIDVRVFVLATAPRLVLLSEAPTDSRAGDAGVAHRIPPQLVSDAQQFAVAVLGYNPGLRLQLRPGLRQLFPPGWRSVLEVLDRARAAVPAWQALRGAAHPYNAVLGLAVLAIGHGVLGPDALPAGVAPCAWGGLADWNYRRLEDLRHGLRAVAALPQLPAYDALCRTCPVLPALVTEIGGADLGGHRAASRTLRPALAREAAAGKAVEAASPPDGSAIDPSLVAGLTRAQRVMLEQLTAHAPHFREFVLCPRVTPSGREEPLRPATVAHVLTAVDHALATYLRLRPVLEAAGVLWHSLHLLTPEALLSMHVPLGLLTVTPATLRGRPSVAAGLVQSGFAGGSVGATVPLLHLLFDAQAAASVARSPRAAAGVASHDPERPPVRFTQALAKEASDYAHAFDRRMQTGSAAHSPERAHLADLLRAAKDVARHVAAGVGAVGRELKEPGRLLDLVTLPQLVCVGLPRLAAELHARHAALCAAGRGDDFPPEFVTLLEAYACTAAIVADTIRQKNLRNARLGRELVVTWDARGPGRGVAGVHTRFTGTGGDNLAASLKMKWEWVPDASGRGRRCERKREQAWSPAIVDLELWGLYLTVRTSRLPAGARTMSRAGAGLGLPVFLSAKGLGEPMTDGLFRERVAEGLHWVCTAALGRDLPPWSEFRRSRGASHYALFGPHAVRALAASYWMGLRPKSVIGAGLSADVRRRLRALQAGQPGRPGRPALGETGTAYVTELLNDTARTLAKDYVVVTPTMAAMRHVPVTSLPPGERWTHPHAYDAWMDRVVAGEAIVWHRERGLPLPPGCRPQHFDPRWSCIEPGHAPVARQR